MIVLTDRILPAAAVALVAGTLVALVPRHGVAQGGNPRSATVQKVYPSAVRVHIAAAGKLVRSASGIAFARDGESTYVLTNAHVVDPSRAWQEPIELRVLVSGAKEPLLARVVARGRVPDTDLAVLEVRTSDIPVTALAVDDALDLGDDLVVIGAPFGKGLSVAAGIVSQVEYDFAENASAPRRPKSLKTDAAIGYGSSGGGVFDVPGGRLVGLVEGYRTARVAFGKDEGYSFDVPMPGETFVAPAAKIRRFLGEHGLSRLAPGRPPATAMAPAGSSPSRAPVVPTAAAPMETRSAHLDPESAVRRSERGPDALAHRQVADGAEPGRQEDRGVPIDLQPHRSGIGFHRDCVIFSAGGGEGPGHGADLRDASRSSIRSAGGCSWLARLGRAFQVCVFGRTGGRGELRKPQVEGERREPQREDRAERAGSQRRGRVAHRGALFTSPRPAPACPIG